MIAALLLAVAAPSAIDAERAFAADAQKLGQWTAFRKYATDDAVMFVPQQVNAQAFLKDREDPPTAVFWWPGKSFVSCDGNYAVNTGPWVRQYGKAVGYFTTVWQRQTDGDWKWIYDGGDGLTTARAEGGDITQTTAACDAKPPRQGAIKVNPVTGKEMSVGAGRSTDGTLAWSWTVGPNGDRFFLALLWDGKKFIPVIEDKIAAEPK